MYEDIILKVLQEKTDRDHPLDYEKIPEWCELRGLDVLEHKQGLHTVASYLSAMVGAADSWENRPCSQNPYVKRLRMVNYLGQTRYCYWYECDD